VALHHLGYPAEIVPGEVIINQILCLKASADGQTCAEPAPADELLDPGDTLREVDGSALSTIDDLGPVLARHEVGDSVHVKFERPGKGKQEGDVTLIASNDGTNRAIIGFQPVDTATAKLPFEVTIRTEAIGGPSAGLAFTLTLIDELTPGELTGKNRIAVTGTINADGTVGAIGGLNAKTSAVKQAGAKVFIVPSEQGHDPDNPDSIETAKKVAGNDLIIVDVKNLDEALAALAKYGGNSGSLGQPGADYKPTT
jgi:PDZ domain-containing protein